ncbi:unnamed protein product [Bemisia tabaci]|uniref:PABS domain-containing protein n=1 Tax=Bemisia tabaci TaxID=7038 RepID=A0A9P0F7W4_BEMTA|nr:unnamed protein product [Bemisia tabaci]
MAVHTILIDFTVTPLKVKSEWQKISSSVEKVLSGYLPDLTPLRKESIEDGQELKPLSTFTAKRDTYVIVRGFPNGLVTVNVEYFKREDEEPLLTFDDVKKIESSVSELIESSKSHKYPPIKRGRNIDRYFLTSDERILEYDIDKVIFEEKSPYQKVQIVHSKSLGNLLLLDELQNLAESDLIYTETLMQRGKINYENKEIVILGGGDGALLYELLKEKPKFVTMLELDPVVLRACKEHLRGCCGDCLDTMKGENYEIIVDDCIYSLDKMIAEGKKVDFVFGDLTDIPVATSPQGEAWDFIKLILNMSFKVLAPNGKYLTHGNGASSPESLKMFETVLSSLEVPVEFSTDHAFVPSFLEDWIFYQIWAKPQSK